jgi:hypothetical protein
LDNSKVKKDLGIKFRPIDKAIVEAAESMISKGVVKQKNAVSVTKVAGSLSVAIVIGVLAILMYRLW